jgi:DNA-binding MarR family transcriptional regulator
MTRSDDGRGRQTRRRPHRDEELFLQILRTADRLTQGELRILRARDLTFSQYNVLRILRGAGPAGLPCSEIAARMIHRDSDITRLLDRLEERDLVERERSAQDRRIVEVRISSAGLALLEDLDKPVTAVHRRQLSRLSAGDQATLRSLLAAATAGADPAQES